MSTTGPTISPRTSSRSSRRTAGIKVNYTTYDSNEILDAKLRTGRSGYDVVVPTASPFFVRQLAANLYQPLDKAKLKNWNNLDPEIMAALAKYDPGNAHGIPWMWGTTGIGYNVAEIRKRMPDAPVDSLRMIFDPAVVSKFKDCGVMMLDSATDVLPAALKYLGLDPDSKKPEDLAKAADVVQGDPALHPQVPLLGVHQRAGRREHLPRLRLSPATSSRRATAPPRPRTSATSPTPSPRRARCSGSTSRPSPRTRRTPTGAYSFLDFMLEPKVAAASSELTGYANANKAATRAAAQGDLGQSADLSAGRRAREVLHHHRRRRRADARAHAAVDHDQDRPLSWRR